MEYKAKVLATVEMIVWINEDSVGNKEIDDIDEVIEVEDFEVKNIIY